MDGNRTGKKGAVHFENEELTGTNIRFYHIEGDKFGIEVCLPKDVTDRIDMKKIDSGEHPKGYYTMGRFMEVVTVLTKHAVMHPDCVEVTNFNGTKQNVSDIGVDKMMMEMLHSVAHEQYDREVASGLVPEGMTFDEWTEVAAPDTSAMDGADKGKPTLH